jgi:hypothetical protein
MNHLVREPEVFYEVDAFTETACGIPLGELKHGTWTHIARPSELPVGPARITCSTCRDSFGPESRSPEAVEAWLLTT